MKKVIYHGDNYGTTQLNPKRMLVGNSQEGVGIYFSDSRSTAEDYGKDIVSVEVDTRNLIPSREYVDEHIPDRKLLPFLKSCFAKNVEDVWMLMTDYGIEVYTPEEVEDYHIEEFAELLHDEQVRNFQITIAQAVGVENFVKLWNEHIEIDGTFHPNRDDEMWYAIINTDLKLRKEESIMNVITLTEDVVLDMGDREIILEKGDRIRVLEKVGRYLDLSKSQDLLTLEGFSKGKEIKIVLEWQRPTLSATVYQIVVHQIEDDILEMVYHKSNDRGGSIEQVMAGVFNYFGFPIPKDDTFGSGLNIDLMIDYLVNEEDYIV